MKTQIKSSLMLASVFAAVISLASCTKDEISQIKPATEAPAEKIGLPYTGIPVSGVKKVPDLTGNNITKIHMGGKSSQPHSKEIKQVN